MERGITDSTGKPLREGSLVRFRGKEYTIRDWTLFDNATLASITFNEPQHIREVANEMSVDLITY